MSHRTGKIEIVGFINDEIYFKYHQAKDPKNHGKFFKRKLKPDAAWLDELDYESNHGSKSIDTLTSSLTMTDHMVCSGERT